MVDWGTCSADKRFVAVSLMVGDRITRLFCSTFAPIIVDKFESVFSEQSPMGSKHG